MPNIKKFNCATFNDNTALHVEVESAFIRALPAFAIVGMTSLSIQESKDRIKSALASVDFSFPPQKITVSLSPSDIKKDGSHFDLGIAIMLFLQKSNVDLSDYFIFGELGLNGDVRSTDAIFPIILSLASKHKDLKIIVPKDIHHKVSQIPNIKTKGVKNLCEAIEFLSQETKKFEPSQELEASEFLYINEKKYYFCNDYELDFADMVGQSRLKHALAISASGMHNIMLEGSPGCGKSMSAKRLPFIMPPMGIEEVLASNIQEDITSKLKIKRVFRSPHHSSSRPSIFGGGSHRAMPGEVALAHGGILFFDELPHFPKAILESLREPLEDHQLLVSRVNSKIKYETKFLFIAAANPCPCGNLFSTQKECRCTELEINRYKNHISEPIHDRIDMYLQVDEEKNTNKTQTSKELHVMVLKAFKAQKNRNQSELNGKLSAKELLKIANLDEEADQILTKAKNSFALSHRGANKIIAIARTIADINECAHIKKPHILEALSYRRR